MSFNAIIIIFLVLCLIIISYSIWKTTRVDDKKINTDVPYNCVGTECKVECGVLSPFTIKECTNDENGNKICANCKCDESGHLSGCMKCQESDPDNPQLRYALKAIGESQCIDPLKWDKDNEVCVLKKGFFCLPKHIEEIDCNPYTGRKLLNYDATNRTYGWLCDCKDDTKFSGSICNQINVCGLEGSDKNPDNSLGGRGLVNKNNNDDYWNNKSNWDPLATDQNDNYLNSSCVCKSNEFANNTNLTCLPSDCYPGFSDPENPTQSCNCKCDSCTGLIDCNKISTTFDPQTGPYYNGICKRPSCVPDPCGGFDKNGVSKGYYDYVLDEKGNPKSGICVCNTEQGYHLVKDPSYFGGYKCAKLCENNGPCGDRGDCVIRELDETFTNFTILCNDQDEYSGQCIGSGLFLITYVNGKTTYYLNYNSKNKSLTLDCAQSKDSYFSFKLKSCDSKYTDGVCVNKVSDKVKNGLISESYYYMMIGDKYLIFNNDLSFDLVDENDPNKDKSLFFFSTSIGNKQPTPVSSGTIFLDKINKYLSATNKNPPSLLYKSKTTTQVSCDNCKTDRGWRQDINDPNQLCRESCSAPGITIKDDWGGIKPYCAYYLGSSCGISDKPSLPPDYDEDSYKTCCYGGTYSLDEKYVPTGIIITPYLYYARKVLTCSDNKNSPNTPTPEPVDKNKNYC